jgi:hypothetical protein
MVMRLTPRWSQPPLALAVPLSRFASRVGGGSAFYVILHLASQPIRLILCIPYILSKNSTHPKLFFATLHFRPEFANL